MNISLSLLQINFQQIMGKLFQFLELLFFHRIIFAKEIMISSSRTVAPIIDAITYNPQDSLHEHELRLGYHKFNMLAWSILTLSSFLGENISSFCCPWCFHRRNTFQKMIGVEQIGQMQDNIFSISQFSFLSKPRIIFLQTGLILPG